jgi:hypothetical protein
LRQPDLGPLKVFFNICPHVNNADD